MKYIVDRIEENFAVCEVENSDEIKNINLDEIPFIVNEGDVLICENASWSRDEQEEIETHERIKNKMEDLWN